MFLNHIGKPSIYLPVCMMIWGSISILTGITTKSVSILFCSFTVHVLIRAALRSSSFTGALLTRFFLGFVSCFMSLIRACQRLEPPDRLKPPSFPVHCSSYQSGISVTNLAYGPLCCIAEAWSVTDLDLWSLLGFWMVWTVNLAVQRGGTWIW